MIEIKYNGKELEIFHTGDIYSKERLIEHLSENGHEREFVSYYLSFKFYEKCKEISGLVDQLFDKKRRK